MLAVILRLAEWVSAALPYLAIVVVLGSPLIKKWLDAHIARRVAHRFDKELEDHRHQLSVEAERIKAVYQSDLHNLSIVTAKKHEVGRRLFNRSCIAQGAVGGLFGTQSWGNLDELSAHEIEAYMTQQRYSAASRSTVLALWLSDRATALKELRRVDYLAQTHKAEEEFIRARNYHLSNALYWGEDVQQAADTLFETLRLLLTNARTPVGARPYDSVDLRDRSRQELAALRQALKQALRIEVEVPGNRLPAMPPKA